MPGLLDFLYGNGPSAGDYPGVSGMQNSLVGLGMGLLSGGGPIGWQNALKGYESGAKVDAANRYHAQTLAERKAERAQQQSNWEKQFSVSSQLPAEREASLLYPNDPEKRRAYIEAKLGPEGAQQVITNPTDEMPYTYNPRTPGVPAQPIQFGAQAPARPAAPPIVTAVPYGQAGQGSGGFGTGVVGAGPGLQQTYGAETPQFAEPQARTNMWGDAIAPQAAAPGIQYPPGAETWKPSQRKEYDKAYLAGVAKQNVGKEGQKESAQRYGDIVTQDIDRAINLIDNGSGPVTGLAGKAYGAIVPSSSAGTLSGLLETIKANSSFDRLQAMRAASPTGGALGQVSDKENKLLQAAMGDLDQSRNSQELKYNLDRVKRIYSGIVHGPGTGGPSPYSPPSVQNRPFGAQPSGGRGANLPDPFGIR